MALFIKTSRIIKTSRTPSTCYAKALPLVSAAILWGGLVLGWTTGKCWAQELVISEFLAVNDASLDDEDGDYSDWIEIQNQDTSTVDLAGWYLTDDPEIFKWSFPATMLPPGEFLVVFASGKNRAEPGRELHTDFRLSGGGEYLALGMPDGTVVNEYAPQFPPQRSDIAFGISQEITVTELVAAGAAASVRIPASGSDGLDWTLPDHDDFSWTRGTTGVGYDTDPDVVLGPEESPNLALNGTATQSTTGFGGVASRAIDGNRNSSFGGGSITHTATGDPAPWWEVGLERSANLDRIVLWNRDDCCSERLSNFRVLVLDDARGIVFADDFFTGGGFPPAGVGFEISLPPSTQGRYVRVELLGPNTNGGRYLSLAEVEVSERVLLGYGELIGVDVEDSMLGENASAYIRVPFEVADPAAIEVLKLRVKYDDGFVAYLNGREVARRNAPAVLAWNSAATSDRPDSEAVVFEEINISGHLNALGSGENVLAIHGLNVSEDDVDFLVVPELEGSLVLNGGLRYFPEPTPGATNDTPGFLSFVADTTFSVDRGFYDAPFAVSITTETPGAEIRYTTDGSVPAENTGVLYGGPLNIDTTTVLRAAAFKESYIATNVDTQTYIFPADVVRQTGTGFPASWGGWPADYGMDPNVVNHTSYRDTIVRDLQTIPSLSIVMDIRDLFGATGIYSNPEGRGIAWERPCSMELVYPDSSEGFQVNCGVRIFGYGWRSHSASLKHAFRLLFKRRYGPVKLRYPFFPDWPVREFDDIVLRSQGSRSWNDFRTSIEQTQYIRDAWARYTARDMGKLTTSSTYVHLYLNGLYWGLYNPVERPDAEFLENHLGGDEEDYDALNARVGNIEVIDGSRENWDGLIAMVEGEVSSLRAFEAVQELLDVPDLIDYMLINFYTVNRDWVGSNGNNMRVAGAPSVQGFKQFCWDAEYSIWNATDNVMNVRTDYDTPALVYARLRTNLEFRLLFADHAHRHLFHGGALTQEKTAERFMDRSREIDRAIVGESARWGDRRREPPYTRDVEWVRERDRLLNSFFPQRTDIMLTQLIQAGMYPRVEAPVFDQHGGAIEPGFSLRLLRTAGQILYTLDGTDPRLPGGAVSPAALESGIAERSTLLPSEAPVRVLVPTNGSLGLDWIAPDFDDSDWQLGTTGVGYEATTGYEDLINTDLQDQLHRVNASLYLRLEFEVDNLAGVDFLTLRMKYDDGFVVYLNGQRVASANAPQEPLGNSVATASNSDSRAVVFEDFDISEAVDLLRAGRNVLAIHGLNQNTTSSDMLILPEITASQASGQEIILNRTTRVRARALLDSSWSAMNEALFVVDSSSLRITEVMYNPPSPPPGSPHDNDQFEYIELQNVGARPLNLMAIYFSSGIRFVFPDGSQDLVDDLAPGEVVLIVRNIEAFESRYDTRGMRIMGEYDGALDNGGELIVLRDPLGVPVLDFVYSDTWYPVTDGLGYSLEIVDPRAAPETWRDRASWRASQQVGGSPGEGPELGTGGLQLPGNANQDAKLDISDAVALLLILFTGTPEVLPCEGGTILDSGNRLLLDANGDGNVDLSDAIHLLAYLFQGGPGPVLGTECTQIVGCPDACPG